MEGTGVYHELATLSLLYAGATVSIVNPAQVKNFGGGLGIRTKTDNIDSLVLARCGALLQPKPWSPPSPEARVLQALLSRRDTLWGTRAIAQDLQCERNRLEKTKVIDAPEIIQNSITDSIAFLEKQLSKLQLDINNYINRYPKLQADNELLNSIPAVGPQVSNHMLSVIHNHSFQSAEQLAALVPQRVYLGLVPLEHQSGTSILGHPKLSKAGPARIRAILCMAAITAARCPASIIFAGSYCLT